MEFLCNNGKSACGWTIYGFCLGGEIKISRRGDITREASFREQGEIERPCLLQQVLDLIQSPLHITEVVLDLERCAPHLIYVSRFFSLWLTCIFTQKKRCARAMDIRGLPLSVGEGELLCEGGAIQACHCASGCTSGCTLLGECFDLFVLAQYIVGTERSQHDAENSEDRAKVSAHEVTG